MADDDALVTFLRSVPLLRGLPAEDVTRLVRKAPAPKTYRPAARDAEPTVIYSEGDPSTALYLLLDETAGPRAAAGADGSRPVVQVSVEDEKLTTRVRLWRVYPRNYFGDFEFLSESESGRFPPRMTKAVPLSACRVFELPYALLNEFIDQHPMLLRRLVREAMARFQQTLEETLAEKVSDPDIALANWLVERARDFGIREGNHVRFRTAISQEAIGKDLGVARETISLRLNEWRRRGLLGSGRGQQLVIRDMERVERIAALAFERSPDEHRDAVATVDAALRRGDNFRARNFALDVLNYFPGSAELKHRAALAVARCGATREALGLLERFGFGRDVAPEHVDRVARAGIVDPSVAPKQNLDDFDLEEINEQIAAAGEKEKAATLTEDILALSPRLWKDLAFRSGKVDAQAAKEAYEGYRRAFTASERPYTGVNAASMALLLGKSGEASELVQQAQKKLPRRATTYWDFVTKGEALLIGGDSKGAAACIADALACPDAYEGSIAATRLQLTRLAQANVAGAKELLAALPNRPVAVFCGPAITGRDKADGQAAATEALSVAAKALIRERRIGHVYGGLRAGAELIIAEAALAEGAALHAVLPVPVDDYITQAVVPGDAGARGTTPSWRARFESCLSKAASLTLLAQRPPPARESDAAALQAFRHASGLAFAKADALHSHCLLLAAGGRPAGVDLSAWERPERSIIDVPCEWNARSAPPSAAVNPWRPTVFVWLLNAQAPEGQLNARGVSDKAIDAAEAKVKAAAGSKATVLRRLLGGNRPQAALVVVAQDTESALDLAAKLAATTWSPGVTAQVTLDYGPVMAGAGGTPHEERLKDLDTGGGPLEAPEGLLLASAAFTMEARLTLGPAMSVVALGRVARVEPSAAVQLLPSTEIYAVAGAQP